MILRTTDAGATWTKQLDGKEAANLLVMSDDQLTLTGYAGTFIAIESTEPETEPPRVNAIWPPLGDHDGSMLIDLLRVTE